MNVFYVPGYKDEKGEGEKKQEKDKSGEKPNTELL